MDSLHRHFAAITQAAFQRHGFASLELAAQWRVIAGTGAAASARPEKISWPRHTAEGRKSGGTLTLRAPAALALDIHYDSPRLIERVNQYLGYGAISQIKVLKSADVPSPPRPLRKPAPAPEINGISEPELAEALARLGSAVATFKTSPHPKTKV
jgi:hypothetical protein